MIRLLIGDCREVLRTLPDESVHCVVTSPPYWGLRDYGTAKWEGGDPQCDHSGVARRCDKEGRNDKQSTQKGSSSDRVSRGCLKCGAHRIDSQIGLEASLGEHVETMVSVFREVRRILRSDGTLWLNYGDSYATNPNGRSAQEVKELGADDRTFRDKPFSTIGPIDRGKRNAARWGGGQNSDVTLKPKDLCGIPWRVAFALQADGWWLRQDIIWSKSNPMPESVTDRCTKAHEYIFLLSKSERYFYDAEAIAETLSKDRPQPSTDQKTISPNQTPWMDNRYAAGASGYGVGGDGKRNKRSVWEVATAPFSEAHFATFPPALIEPCILAGCPKDGTMLDPFGGAGTTGLVADRLGRNAILIELNPEYAAMAERRIRSDAGMFASLERVTA